MKRILSVLCLLVASPAFAQFAATPLTDFAPGQTYLGFPGLLYDGSNTSPTDHAADGANFASQIQPLDTNGNPSPTGKVIALVIGFSNWTGEVCGSQNKRFQRPSCDPGTFIPTEKANASVNPNLVVFDCAMGGQSAPDWVNDAKGLYSTCSTWLVNAGYSEKQVQVILWKDADAGPTVSLSVGTVCSASSMVDACHFENIVGQVARFVKTRYSHLKQMFLHSRIYAGYATVALNPEPYAYEYGFSVKWTIAAQISRVRGGGIDPTAGDLGYPVAPWIDWGAYFWASGTTPRSDGLTWVVSDFDTDGTHPSSTGVIKVGGPPAAPSGMMMNFFLVSPMTPWFRR